VKKYILAHSWAYKRDMRQNDKIPRLALGNGVDCDPETAIECWVLGATLPSPFFPDGGVRSGSFTPVWRDEEVLVTEVR
jgi:hypothetical protein